MAAAVAETVAAGAAAIEAAATAYLKAIFQNQRMGDDLTVGIHHHLFSSRTKSFC
jgi:hypothetical protein